MVHGGIALDDQGVDVSPVLERLPPNVKLAEAVPALRMKPQGRARSAPCAALEAAAEIFLRARPLYCRSAVLL